MNSEDMEHAADSGKREHRPTAKALLAKIESLQKDRKSTVNRVKNMIVSMKELMKCDDNASQVSSMLKTMKLLMDDASVLHKRVLPLLPLEEQTKQNEWFDSISKHYNGFVKDVEQWMTETGKSNLCITPSGTHEPRLMEVDATSQGIRASDVSPSVEVVSTTHDTRLSNVHLQAGMDSGDEIQPMDSVSNISSKRSTGVASHGSRSSRSSISSTRLKAEAELAALLASQQMLQKKHELEEQEEQLRKRREKLDLETKLAESMARVKVYQDVRSESHVSINRIVSQPLHSDMESFVPSVSVPAPSEFLPVSHASHVDNTQKISNSQSQLVQQPSTRSKTKPSQSTLPNTFPLDSHTSMLQFIGKQNEIATLLVKQHNLASLPPREIPYFDGDPFRFHEFMRSFEEVVEKKADSPGDCLHFLEQYTRGQPKELVRSCQHMIPSQGYLRAKALLKENFGNEVKIAASYMEKALSWKVIRSEDAKALQEYGLFLRSCCNAMQDINYMNELNLTTNMQVILSKLPYKLKDKWRVVAYELKERRHNQTTFTDIVDFIERQVKILSDPVFGNIQDVTPAGGKKMNIRTIQPKARSSFATTITAVPELKEHGKITTYRSCLFCSGEHSLDVCNKLTRRSHSEKMNFLKTKGICFGCLHTGHFSRDCKKRSICNICSLKHPSLLHIYSYEKEDTSGQKKAEFKPAVGSAMVSLQTSGLTGAGKDNCALSIVPVCVKSKKGNSVVMTYAFLDSGSSASFCTESLMNKLNLPGKRVNILLRTMSQDKSVGSYVLKDLEVSGLSQEVYCALPEVYTQETMPVTTANIASQKDLECWPHLSNICLPKINAGIELLIGANVPEALEPWEIIRSQDNGPYAVRTMFGWTVNGPLKGVTIIGDDAADQSPVTVNRIAVMKLEELWKQQFKADFPETVHEEQTGMSKEDQQFMNYMSHSAKLINGHYYIGLPFRDADVVMPRNRRIAEQRALTLQRKFKVNSSFHAEYTTFMEDVIYKGYAERVPVAELERCDGRLWFIPHHGVYHPKKHKIRVVFDCGASYQGISLNGKLLQGPDLTSSLVSVLVRFRLESVALMADIESMFHQVRVHPEDCDLLRFLWWPEGNINGNLEEYRMLVHLFGATSSPSCSSFALRKCAMDQKDLFDSKTLDVVFNNFYVDDCLVSVPSESEAVQLYKDLTNMCANGGFHLTKWMSNSRAVLGSIPEKDREKKVKDLDLDSDTLPLERALGVQWCAESDAFHFKVVVKDRPLTRRGILSVVSSIYDPLGFLSPVILSAKRILQDLCREGIGWDNVIPPMYVQRWMNWLDDLHRLDSFKVRRCLKPDGFGEVKSAQMHHFSDASEQGYGVVSYLLLHNNQNLVHSTLLVSKARVTPLKPITIPRLELTAATLASRIDRIWTKELKMPFQDSIFWTDSTSVLKYLRNKTSRFKCFVANRVSEILKASDVSQWWYVNSSSNPADLVSRGVKVDSFLKNEMWISGPTFLMRPQEEWPVDPTNRNEVLSHDPEIKRSAMVNMVEVKEESDSVLRLFNYFSSWIRLKKSVAWLLRLKGILMDLSKERKRLQTNLVCPGSDLNQQRMTINKEMQKFKSAVCKDLPSLEELDKAEMEIIRLSQRKRFSEELTSLRKNGVVKRNSPLYSLNPILQSDLIRVGGRLDKALIPEDSKHPIILAKDLHISNLILRQIHEEIGHGGRNFMLATLRQRYWIPGASAAIRSIVSKCVVCRRFSGIAGHQQMADLPQDRVSPDKPPFTHVGVDCFGPFEVKRGRTILKRYGVIFTCLAIRAVHIEMIASLDTDSFIHALRRFIARRGQVAEIRSDNGTNFVGAEHELQEAIQNWNHNQINNVLLQKKIKWTFNPPTGSHHGGIWERLIRSIKKILNSILRGQSMDEEGLQTLLCEVESILNNRPITRSSLDPNDLETLTPNHLLLLKQELALPPGLFKKDDVYARRRWRQIQYLANLFWKRWIGEYLPLLQERQKWMVKTRNFQVGDVVLVVDNNAPRSSWIMGKIIHTIEDKKGFTRQVKIKTMSTCLTRPITKLCRILEAEEFKD